MTQSQNPVHYALSSWDIPPAYLDRLDRYYLLHWKTDWFYEQCRDPIKTGIYFSSIRHQDIDYNVQWPVEGIALIRDYAEMILSFRRINGWERGYVLIRPKLGTEKT
jgi:hypothetical protein